MMATARNPASRAKSKDQTTMKDTTIGAGSPVYFSIRQAAWLLGVSESRVCRAIRVGTLRAVRRRSRLVIPTAEVRRVLDGGAR